MMRRYMIGFVIGILCMGYLYSPITVQATTNTTVGRISFKADPTAKPHPLPDQTTPTKEPVIMKKKEQYLPKTGEVLGNTFIVLLGSWLVFIAYSVFFFKSEEQRR